MAGFLSFLRSRFQATETAETSSSHSPKTLFRYFSRHLSIERQQRPPQQFSCDLDLNLIDELESAGLTFDTMSFSEDVPPRKKRKLSPSTKQQVPTCHFCREDLTTDDWARPCRTCQSLVCHPCMKRQFDTALRDHEQMPVRCCGRVIHFTVMDQLLPDDELSKYVTRWDENQTPNPFYCPKPTCSAFIPPRNIHPIKNKIDCANCDTKICIICREAAQQDHKCTDDSERQTILCTYGYKQCPKCLQGVMRMFGCNHVRCQCGAHWCYECRRPIDACNRNPCDRADDEELYGDDLAPLSEDDNEITIANENENGSQIEQELASANENLVHETNTQVVNETPSIEPQTTQVAAEALPNLDDPQSRSWEAEDLDFGDEPGSESHDIWGCHHSYRVFTTEHVHKRWLVGLDNPYKLETIQCLGCFKNTVVGTKTPSSTPKPGIKAETDVTVSPTTDDPGEPGQTPTKKQAAYECMSCGVIHCYRCRKVALKKMTAWKDEIVSP